MNIITIGRATTNNVVLQDSHVSSTHAQIIIKPNNCYSIVDLNSTNGTYVNNIKIYGETVLNANDVVKIGNTVIPWQQYVNASNKQTGVGVVTLTNTSSNNENPPQQTPQEQKTGVWSYVICSVVTAILVGGIMGILMYSVSNSKQQEITDLNKQLAELNEDIEDIKVKGINDKTDLYDQQQELQQDLDKQIAAFNKTASELSTANKDNKELQAKIMEIQGTVNELQKSLKTTTEDLRKKEAALVTAENNLNTKQAELTAKQEELDKKQTELDKATAQLASSNNSNNDLQAEITRLNGVIDGFQLKTIPTLEKEKADFEAKNKKLNEKIARLEEQIEKLKQSKKSEQNNNTEVDGSKPAESQNIEVKSEE